MEDPPRRVLDAIGAANERLIALAARMRRRLGVKQVRHKFD
jgi:hypothetical protein